ncbi:MAG: T9SS type A sorting domain-containing protein [Bacteroidetes bacterium]|nr:T9SS type A sorting domain-containing protein [Bacteroidota bacterium]
MHARRLLPGCSPRISVLSLLLAITMVTVASAQSPALDPTSSGTSFIIAFPDTTTTITDPRYVNPLQDQIALFIYSAVDNQVHVHGLRLDTLVYPKAGKFLTVPIQTNNFTTDSSFLVNAGTTSNNVFHVDARSPIVMYCYVMTKFGGEMWTPMPVENWGKQYYVTGTPGEIVVDMKQVQRSYQRQNRMGSVSVVILAAYDTTNVTIYPTGTFLNAPLKVTLNAGDAYEMESLVDTIASHSGLPQPDVGGSLITSNRPIGVISGNSRAQVISDVTAATGNSLKNCGYEWLAPSEQFGTTFVYMPTMDSRHLTGVRNEKVSEKRGFEQVRAYGASQGLSRIYYQVDSVHYDTSMLSSTRIMDYKIEAVKARVIRADKPTQVLLHSSAVSRYNGTGKPTPSVGNYTTWGAYTVQLMPREQWTTFAPYFAPSYPFETAHYINVVADTSQLDKIYNEDGSPFEFNMGQIPGTDLMWGTAQITTGTTHYLEGRNGARFYAYAYGTREGLENQTTITSLDYQEVVALSYGYPLAPGYRILRGSDSVKIDTNRTPCGLHVKAQAVNTDPLGFRSAKLDSANNLALQFVAPASAPELIGYGSGEFMLVPVDPQKNASGVLVLSDRSGKTWRVPYGFTAASVSVNAGVVFDLGNVNVNETKDTVVEITNTQTFPVTVSRVRLALGNQLMTIDSTEPDGPARIPAVPVTLAPGEKLRVHVLATPHVKDRVYSDTLRVSLSCYDFPLPLRMGAVGPCIQVSDLDFGELTLNQSRTLVLRICNQGGGVVTLNNPSGDSVITWLLANFSITRSALDSLRNVQLGPGACLNVPVTFVSAVPGTFEITARIWASTRDCRDTSIWHAVVKKPQSQGVPASTGAGYAITSVRPNPFSNRSEIGFTVGSAGETTVEIYNAVGERMALLYSGRLSAGEHAAIWDAAGFPSGVYHCRITSGAWAASRMLILAR